MLILAVLAALVLDGVVGQVDVTVFEVFNVIFEAGGSDVSLLVEVAPVMDAINDLSESEHSNVELSHRTLVPESSSDEKRIVNVLLNNPTLLGSRRLEKVANLIEAVKDNDAIATVGVLARFTYPYLELVILVLALFDHTLYFLSQFLKLRIFIHFAARFNVVGKRHKMEWILWSLLRSLVAILKVKSHGCEQIRFVRQKSVPFNFRVDLLTCQLVNDARLLPLRPKKANIIKGCR